MNTFTTNDGTQIYYKDWGGGQPIVLSHGWPLSSDSWESQMLFLAEQGYRCIAHDRRGHGRSSQPWHGNDMDTYADDLAQLIEKLDLHDIVLMGFSTGGGEITRYIGRHGTNRVTEGGARQCCAAADAANARQSRRPADEGVRRRPRGFAPESLAVLTRISPPARSSASTGRGEEIARPHRFLLAAGHDGGAQNAYDCIKAFSETDFREDLKKFDVPTLIIHGDDDQIVPIIAAARIGQAREECDAQGLPRRTARHHGYAQGPTERGPLRIHSIIIVIQRIAGLHCLNCDRSTNRGSRPCASRKRTTFKR